MKKSILVILVVALIMLLCACSNSTVDDNPGTEGNNQAVNPISDCTTDEMANKLGLLKIDVEGITSSTVIAGDNPIYQLDVKDTIEYNLRIAKAVDGGSADISGIYLEEETIDAIYDSADINEAPTMYVAKDSNYTVAYCEWNGYYFSVSAENVDLSEMKTISTELAQKLISNNNICK